MSHCRLSGLNCDISTGLDLAPSKGTFTKYWKCLVLKKPLKTPRFFPDHRSAAKIIGLAHLSRLFGVMARTISIHTFEVDPKEADVLNREASAFNNARDGMRRDEV